VKIDQVMNNLSVSDANLPSLFDSRVNAPSIPIPPIPPINLKKDVKGKGRAKRQLGKDTRKGKAKVKFTGVDSETASASESESGSETESETGSESESDVESGSQNSTNSDGEGPNGAQPPPAKPTIGWRRTVPGGMPSSSTTTTPAAPQQVLTSSSEESGSETMGGSDTGDERPAAPVASSSSAKKNNRRKRGPCESPVLCKICYDEYDRWEKVHQFSGCEHTYCRDCLRDYLATNINEGAVLDLTCPFPECRTEFSTKDVKFLCTSEIYAKFERFTLLAALRADPNARWCPNPYCNNGIKHNPATMPWVHCNACKFEFCFHCMSERHDGAACGQEALEYLKKKHESELAANAQFDEWASVMKALVKPCPGCKAFIEKNDGCNHMTCQNPSCKVQFCWLCLNLFNGDHFVDDINFPDCYDKQYWTPPDLLLQTANIARQAAVIPRSRRFANFAKKVGIYMGVGVAVVTLGVPAAVIGGPVYGCFKLHKRLKARRHNRRYPSWVPPTPERIEEARREAQRLYELEHS